MSQPVTCRRYHLVADEDAPITGDGYREPKREDVEREAERAGMMVAVTSSCGYGWTETRRYDPAESDD